ncbi:MAG: alpha/beta hydrolase [Candidatus Margulisbacteria bacterium]|nr:alpha/beta hydrolase [Candidatus Margulisiibacteriota bacterium]MBU1022192.1 alpha/beta hydrolase [Candidatus Margulisiibacteriota bacterium]MBU1729369.1 alpha/beta hydrolase [Candidatus Margulisiibacteriota bacterium]MBU1955642.1 alpha/beta hydrolase [Candidatus Margulisiibacteriota bacterium]
MQKVAELQTKVKNETFSNVFSPLGLSSVRIAFSKDSNSQRFIIERKDGRDIEVELHLPKGVAGKIKSMVIFPGCAGDSNDMTNIAQSFVKKGFAAWTVDFSVGETESQDFEDYTISQLVKDVKDVVDYVYNHESVDQAQLYIAGHSFGSFSSLLYLARSQDERIKGAIGICPVVDIFEVGFNHTAKLLEKLHHFGRILRVWMWRTKRLLKKAAFFFWRLTGKMFVLKKNGKWVYLTRKFMKDILHVNSREKVMKELSQIKQPCLLLYGDQDPWVSHEHVQEIGDNISADNKNVIALEDEGHMPLGQAGADKILRKTITWLEKIALGIPADEPQIFTAN